MALTKPNKGSTTERGPRVWMPKSTSSIWEGAAVGRYPAGTNAGYIDNIGADPSLEVVGVSRHNCGTVPSGHTATFAAETIVDECIIPMTFAATLSTASRNALVYGVDESTGSLLPIGPPIGMLYEVDSATVGRVGVGPKYVAMASQASGAEDLMPVRLARAALVTNQSLTAFVGVTGGTAQNGVTCVKGDKVLLVGQTTVAENGLYVVGTITVGTAPLTRDASMPAGFALPNGSIVSCSEGTEYKLSTWKSTATTTGGAVIGTNDPAFYPQTYRLEVALSSGTYTVGFGSTATPDEALFLLAGANVQISRVTHGGTIGTDGYEAPSGSRVTGVPGTAVIVVNSINANGATGSSDTSTVDILVTNF